MVSFISPWRFGIHTKCQASLLYRRKILRLYVFRFYVLRHYVLRLYVLLFTFYAITFYVFTSCLSAPLREVAL